MCYIIIIIVNFSQAFNIIIDLGTSAPGHVIEVVDGINVTYKRFIFNLMDTIKLPDSQIFDTQLAMHTSTHNADISLSQ